MADAEKMDSCLRTEMKRYGITDKTISILENEEFLQVIHIVSIDDSILQDICTKYQLKLGQKGVLKKFISVKIDESKRKDGNEASMDGLPYARMDDLLRDLIRGNMFRLGNTIKDVETVIVILYSEKILSDKEFELCKIKRNRREKIWKLMEIIREKTDEAFYAFVRALDRANQLTAVQMLISDCCDHSKGEHIVYIHK